MTKLIRSLTVFLLLVLTVFLNWNCSDTVIDIPQVLNEQQTDGSSAGTYQITFTISQNFLFYPDGGGSSTSRTLFVWSKTANFNGIGYSSYESFTTHPATFHADGGTYVHSNFQLYTYYTWANAPSVDYHGISEIDNGIGIVAYLCSYPPSGGVKWTDELTNSLIPNTTYNGRVGILSYYPDPFC